MKGRNFNTIILSFSWLGIVLSACGSTNKTVTDPSHFAKVIKKSNRKHHSLLMFSGVDSFVVTHIMLENRRRDMTVQLDRIDSAQKMALMNTGAAKAKQAVLYMRDSTSYLLKEPHTIAVSKIERIQVIE